jgi:hypothetical protein
MSTNVNDFLLGGGGGASARFDNIGDTITGTILNLEMRQRTDIATGDPLTWPNGDPQMQAVIAVQTTEQDDEDDDGIRVLYVKGSKKAGSRSLHDAVATAAKTAGKNLEPGGTLTVTYTGDEPSKTKGFNPRKLYSATYAAPDKTAPVAAFLNPQTPTPPAAPAATPTEMSPEQLAEFAAWRLKQAK